MEKYAFLLIALTLCISGTGFAANAVVNGTFDSTANWSFADITGDTAGTLSTGGIAGGIMTITHEASPSGGDGLVCYQSVVGKMVSGNPYTGSVDTQFLSGLGPQAVAEMHIGPQPAASQNDYNGYMILKDDCWSACGAETWSPMAKEAQAAPNNNPFTFGTDTSDEYVVLKSSTRAPGGTVSQAVDFDNVVLQGVLDVHDWMLY